MISRLPFTFSTEIKFLIKEHSEDEGVKNFLDHTDIYRQIFSSMMRLI